MTNLRESLDLEHPPCTIECFGVSHVSGTFVVASMVKFLSGKPHKRGYLRFKIRGFEGNDDFRAMEEIIGRRYGRLLREKSRFPDLVVVDGGAAQVTAAALAFESLGCRPPPLIGLAKREETIFSPTAGLSSSLGGGIPVCACSSGSGTRLIASPTSSTPISGARKSRSRSWTISRGWAKSVKRLCWSISGA